MERAAGILMDMGLPVARYAFSLESPCIVARYSAHSGKSSGIGSIVLYCHLDTATYETGKWRVDPLSATEIKGRIYGRGTIDCKGLAAVWLSLLQKISAREEDFPFDLVFVAVSDEEKAESVDMETLLEKTKEFEGTFLVLGEGGGVPLRSGNLTYYTLQTGEMERWTFETAPNAKPQRYRLGTLLEGFWCRAYTRETLGFLVRGILGFRDPDRTLESNPLEQERAEGLIWYRTAFGKCPQPFRSSNNVVTKIVATGVPRASNIGIKTARRVLRRIDRKFRALPLVTRGYSDNRCFRIRGIPTLGFFPLSTGNSLAGCHRENEYISIKSLHFAEEVLESMLMEFKEAIGG